MARKILEFKVRLLISMVLFTYLLVSIKKKRRFDQNQISPLAYTDHSDLLAEYQHHQ